MRNKGAVGMDAQALALHELSRLVEGAADEINGHAGALMEKITDADVNGDARCLVKLAMDNCAAIAGILEGKAVARQLERREILWSGQLDVTREGGGGDAGR